VPASGDPGVAVLPVAMDAASGVVA
jgi:hypothetical protein